jgi:hypothetical protein
MMFDNVGHWFASLFGAFRIQGHSDTYRLSPSQESAVVPKASALDRQV